jgi:hypothetical protein
MDMKLIAREIETNISIDESKLEEIYESFQNYNSMVKRHDKVTEDFIQDYPKE